MKTVQNKKIKNVKDVKARVGSMLLIYEVDFLSQASWMSYFTENNLKLGLLVKKHKSDETHSKEYFDVLVDSTTYEYYPVAQCSFGKKTITILRKYDRAIEDITSYPWQGISNVNINGGLYVQPCNQYNSYPYNGSLVVDNTNLYGGQLTIQGGGGTYSSGQISINSGPPGPSLPQPVTFTQINLSDQVLCDNKQFKFPLYSNLSLDHDETFLSLLDMYQSEDK